MEQHMENSAQPIWLTIEQAAERANVSVDTIRRAYYSGALRVTATGTGTAPKRFLASWIDSWMQSRATGGQA